MNTTSNNSVESLYRQFQPTLVGYLEWAFPKLSVEKDAEEVVQNLFITLQRRDTRILGDVLDEDFSMEAALKIHAFRHAIDFLRRKNSVGRGGGNLVSLEALREVGLETGNALFGSECVSCDEPQQFMRLQYLDKLKEVEKVIEAAKPELSEREAILLGHIQNWAPIELSNDELHQELTPMQRQRFLPVKRDTTLAEAEKFIICQISRSKASLQKKLRETRDSLGF